MFPMADSRTLAYPWTVPSSQQRAFFSNQWAPLGLPSHYPRDRKSFSDGAAADNPASGDKAPLRSEISFHWLPAENWSHSGSLPRCMSLSSDTGILSDLWNISLALLIQHKRHKCTHRRGPRAYSSQLGRREKDLWTDLFQARQTASSTR